MNPFIMPDKLFISKRPCDMRAGIQKLAIVVSTDFSMDPTGGALYCFVSRDCKKMELLRFEINGWCLYYIRLSKGKFRWVHHKDGEMSLQIERRQLIWLFDGLDFEQSLAPLPVTAKTIL